MPAHGAARRLHLQRPAPLSGEIRATDVELIADAGATGFADYDHDAAETLDGGHGRVDIRAIGRSATRKRSPTSIPMGHRHGASGTAGEGEGEPRNALLPD